MTDPTLDDLPVAQAEDDSDLGVDPAALAGEYVDDDLEPEDGLDPALTQEVPDGDAGA